MDKNDFIRLTQGHTDFYWCEYFDVGAATFRRWKTGKARIPRAIEILLNMPCNDLSALAGAGEGWEGFFMAKDGLHLPGWKYGFSPGQIKGMFFKCQMVRDYESTIRALNKRIEELEGDFAAETERAEKYRRLVSTESQFGLIWDRVVSP